MKIKEMKKRKIKTWIRTWDRIFF